jgi:Protein of unknown function (DUF3237)
MQGPVVSVAATPQLEHLMAITAEVGDLVSMGPAPLGERRVVYITGGTFAGTRLRGEVVGGADWQVLRRDGAIELDARYALKEARGGIVQVVSQGLRYGSPEVLARLAAGEPVDLASYFFRTFMRFETGAAELAFLNTTLAVATAQRHARRVELQCFQVL